MGVLTNLLKLLKPGENDYYNQQTEQADNWDKVDNYAVLTNTDKNGIWGGEYGGKIQDPIPKEVGKRYIDNINGKAFICIKAGDSSVTSNTTEYFTPCNVVDNLDKIKKISNRRITRIFTNVRSFTLDFTKYEYFVVKGVFGDYQIVEITPDCTVADSGITEISSVGINRDLDTYTGFNISGPGNGVFNLFKNVGRCSGVNIYGVNKIL